MVGKFFKKKDASAETVAILYSTLVLSPPSSESPDALGPAELEIGINQLNRFSEKRLLLLEAMLYFAALTTNEQNIFHPSIQVIKKKITHEWMSRGLITSEDTDIHSICFSEIEKLLAEPFQWAKIWLDEFYVGGEYEGLSGGPHPYTWAEQCSKEFKVMMSLIDQTKDNFSA